MSYNEDDKMLFVPTLMTPIETGLMFDSDIPHDVFRLYCIMSARIETPFCSLFGVDVFAADMGVSEDKIIELVEKMVELKLMSSDGNLSPRDRYKGRLKEFVRFAPTRTEEDIETMRDFISE